MTELTGKRFQRGLHQADAGGYAECAAGKEEHGHQTGGVFEAVEEGQEEGVDSHMRFLCCVGKRIGVYHAASVYDHTLISTAGNKVGKYRNNDQNNEKVGEGVCILADSSIF